MLTTDTQGLPYPEAEDFVSPLQLQALALAADAKIQNLLTEFATVLARSSRIVQLAVNQTGMTGGLVENSIMFDTYAYNTDTNQSPSPYIYFDEWEPGFYIAGLYVSSVAPTPTANSVRKSWLYVEDRPGPAFTDLEVTFWDAETYESSTGGEHQSVLAFFPIYSPDSAHLYAMFSHLNATNMTINAGSYMWVTRLGNLEI